MFMFSLSVYADAHAVELHAVVGGYEDVPAPVDHARLDEVDMTVNDCAKVSRRLSKWLDQEDFIDEQYMLEVCSLGFKDQPGNEDVIPEDVEEEEAAVDEGTDADSEDSHEDTNEDTLTGRGKN